jgi:hypothetical protein
LIPYCSNAFMDQEAGNNDPGDRIGLPQAEQKVRAQPD